MTVFSQTTLVNDAEIYRIARLLLDESRDDAGRVAAERLNQTLDTGDLDGRDVWARIVRAVHELQQEDDAPLPAPLCGKPGRCIDPGNPIQE